MYYLVRLEVRRPDGMTPEEFRKIWRRNAVIMQRSHGTGLVQSFGAVGRRNIFAIAEFSDRAALNEALTELPIIEELGSAVEIEAIPVRPYGGSAAEVGGHMKAVDREADVDGQPGLSGTPQMTGGCSAI